MYVAGAKMCRPTDNPCRQSSKYNGHRALMSLETPDPRLTQHLISTSSALVATATVTCLVSAIIATSLRRRDATRRWCVLDLTAR